MWRPDGQPGSGYWSLPEPPTRANPSHQIVDEYYPAFAALMAEQGKELPGYVQREFEEFLQCGRLEHGFLRVRCESCHAEHPVAFSCKRRGLPARAVGRGGWPKVPPCWLMKYCLNNPCVSGC